ncbi:MAG: hypothetical protein K6F46_05855 [Desulfovibrio sp.]|nr:hypothetical protein [Desulfovibrio sp.]
MVFSACPGARPRKPARGSAGKVLFWAFLLFSVVVVICMVHYVIAVTDYSAAHAVSFIERAAAPIRMRTGLGVMLCVWAAGGAIAGILAFAFAARRRLGGFGHDAAAGSGKRNGFVLPCGLRPASIRRPRRSSACRARRG